MVMAFASETEVSLITITAAPVLVAGLRGRLPTEGHRGRNSRLPGANHHVVSNERGQY